MTKLLYAGIGSRKTPPNIIESIHSLSKELNGLEYTLRSGGAIGADRAFEKYASKKEIFYSKDSTYESHEIAKQFHTKWNDLDDYVKGLMSRNVLILLGKNLDSLVDFVVYWTPQGKISGGTGHSLKIAKHYNIPIYNLYNIEYSKIMNKVRRELFLI